MSSKRSLLPDFRVEHALNDIESLTRWVFVEDLAFQQEERLAEHENCIVRLGNATKNLQPLSTSGFEILALLVTLIIIDRYSFTHIYFLLVEYKETKILKLGIASVRQSIFI